MQIQSSGDYWVEISSPCDVEVDSVNLYFIREEYGLEVPNVITPNNDGFNDSFSVHALASPTYSLIIVDRNGKRVFFSTDPLEGWNGEVGGKHVVSGLYYWLVNGVETPNFHRMNTYF